jgi:hypothetical protein
MIPRWIRKVDRMFTALDTESRVSMQRSQEWLQRSERINRLLASGEVRPHTPLQAFVVTTVRTIVEACPVLRVAFPPAPGRHLSTYR